MIVYCGSGVMVCRPAGIGTPRRLRIRLVVVGGYSARVQTGGWLKDDLDICYAMDDENLECAQAPTSLAAAPIPVGRPSPSDPAAGAAIDSPHGD
jgi:hypothetical protein